MNKLNLNCNNKNTALLFAGIIIIFSFITIFMPLILVRLIPQSGIGNYFIEHLYIAYSFIPIVLYFIYTGIFYYQIKIDSYIINIRSQRILSGIFKSSNYFDISHPMLVGFSFFNRPFSFNKTLMLKIQTDRGKAIAKRFDLTFLSKEEENKISKVLQRIIAKKI